MTNITLTLEDVEKSICGDVSNVFFLMVGAMVFLMQMGFAMLEYSAVHPYHGPTVLLKNLMDVCIAAITWWLLGYGISTGTDHNGFIGTATDGAGSLFYSVQEEMKDGLLTGQNKYAEWFFGFAFAATAATIVSGAVAERTQFAAYFSYSIVLTAIVYPIVSHWIWNEEGWLFKKNLIDFAGSGVVHLTGGVAAFWGAAIVGPRKFIYTVNGFKPRFENGKTHANKFINRGLPFGVLGTIVLWFGWYGFNPGSVLGVCKKGDIMGTAVVTTTISPASAALTGAVYQMISNKVKGIKAGPDPAFICNCILAGLVGITAGAATVENWAAMVIGAISAFVYLGASSLLRVIGVDDVIDAFPVHGACGAWGVVATGIFSSTRLAHVFNGTTQPAGLLYDGSSLLGWQIIAVLAITAWTSVTTVPIFLLLKYTGLLRLSEKLEKMGHGTVDEESAKDNEITMHEI